MNWYLSDVPWHTDPDQIRLVEVLEGYALLEVKEDDNSVSQLVLHPGLFFGHHPRQEHRVVGGAVKLSVETP